ncbi:deacetylase [Candidatus Kinetoplastibacterium desouzaii TCC079E]|uniref:Deacetylase n=1 Tax=Candidatus Kinetoplastidibacterium desouzai TCC079E TaxID=1208919 RepID=M1L2J6_9PROT|nr:histone deacetylase family protein [Candidatus Kinetoplastibacterium desouzaii]AGF46973.1 deacetylase [Candidatus Kinetoplastibacterium desouzaii TCC079E]
METMYITHPTSFIHEMGSFHPDTPRRLDVISDQLLMSGLMPFITTGYPFKALKHDVLRVHTSDYFNSLLTNIPEQGKYYFIDNDTMMNHYTFNSALYAAGSGIFGVNAVFSNYVKNVFCSVRPPGHHACSNKAMGSCFFNNIAIAAKYAFEQYKISKLAIIDFDVHHGNGTEEIFFNDDRVLMCSFFQHPFYPYSKLLNYKKTNMCNIPVDAYSKPSKIREIVSEYWIPEIHKHKPEIILISAGFDAHREDDMGQLFLTESDYAWITDKIVDLSEQYSEGRIVSMLEGGYNFSSLSRSVVAHIRSLAKL